MLTAIVLVIFAAIVRKGLLVKPLRSEDSKRSSPELETLSVTNAGWLGTPTGEWIVAIGLVAIAVSLFAFTVQDISVLLTGDVFRSGLMKSVWYLLWAGLAMLFSAGCVFLCRSAWLKVVITLFSVSMASHILERFVRVPAPQIRLIALCRLFISLGVALVYLRHRFDEPETSN
jgi:hypothetical protein